MSAPVSGTNLRTIAWPTLATERAVQLRSVLDQVRQSERWGAEELRAHQFAHLERLLAHCNGTMLFWRRRLRNVGIEPGTPLTPEIWSRIPVLTRAQAQDAGIKLHSLSVPLGHGETNASTTSGSTGRPLRVVRTELHQLYWSAFQLHDLLWHGLDFQGKMVSIRRDHAGDAGPGLGRRLSNWAELFPTGPASLFEIAKPVAEQAAWLVREDPHYIVSFASNLHLLALHFRASGQKLKRLRALRSFAEVVSPELRDLCREVFGVGILDIYSSEEVGYMALQCPEHEHMHVMSESVYLEVLDEAGQPCAPGQIGRVVVSPLHNFAMPLLRYELGDFAEVGDACPCGRTLPVLRRILGRSRHRVVLPSGEMRFAQFGGRKLNQISSIRQFQLVQKTRTDLELNLVVRRPLSPQEEAHIVDIICDSLGYRFNTTIAYHDEILRSASGKFEDFKSEAV